MSENIGKPGIKGGNWKISEIEIIFKDDGPGRCLLVDIIDQNGESILLTETSTKIGTKKIKGDGITALVINGDEFSSCT